MFKQAAFAAIAASAFIALPASAATTVTFGAMNPGGAVTLTPAGPGAVSAPISFDVSGTGDFSVTFTFSNPFDPAVASGSASFNYDPDVLTFTGGTFGAGSTFSVTAAPSGSSILVDLASLSGGSRSLTLTGNLNPTTTPAGGNNFARVGGSITLTGSVPEPATWALFILGFGAIGHTMRRRSSKVRIAKASLTFA